jgi:hypothetical protein
MIRGEELSRNIVIPNGFLEAEHAIFRANLKVYRELKRPDPDPERGARTRLIQDDEANGRLRH